MMKKPYQQPVTQELPLAWAVPLTTSHFIEGDTESGGGIDPGTEIDTGLSRDFTIGDNDILPIGPLFPGL